MTRPERTHEDTVLGVLERRRGEWCARVVTADGTVLFVSLEGGETRPEARSVSRAKVLLDELERARSQAETFVAGRDLGVFSRSTNGRLVLEGVHVGEVAGRFDLDFGFTEWPDGSITVRFRNDEPSEVLTGD